MTTPLALVLLLSLGCTKKEDASPAPSPKPTTPAPDPAPAPAPAPAPTPSPPAPAAPAADDVSKIKLPDAPAHWTVADGRIELFIPVNESKFPVDNASFEFEYGFETQLPTVEADFNKKSKVPGGMLLESTKNKTFRYVLDNGTGPKIVCGGSLYRDADYNKIPEERDDVIAQVKKACASAKL